MKCLRVGQAAVIAASVWGAGMASTSASAAKALFTSDLVFTFDADTLQRVADQNLILPTVSGQVVYDVDESVPMTFDGFRTSVASPGAGLVSLDIKIATPGESDINLDETFDDDFPEFPEVDLFDNQVVGIDYELSIGNASGFISGNMFGGTADIFVIDGSGTVSFGEAIFIGTDPGDDMGMDDMGGDTPSVPNVIPTPTAAAGGLALIGLVSARRRREA